MSKKLIIILIILILIMPYISIISLANDDGIEEEVIELEDYSKIKGNVTEKIKITDSDDAAEGDQNIGIKGIRVNCIDEDGNINTWTRSDENGNYELTPTQPGKYKVQFVPGDISDVDANDKDTIKNILKYNGQDYMVSGMPQSIGQTTNYTVNDVQNNVTDMSENAIQVAMLIDASGSMSWNQKFQREIKAVKQLIQEFLNSDREIYFNIAKYQTSGCPSTGMTRDPHDELLDQWSSEGAGGDESLVEALEKVKNQFSETSENRCMVVLSDGNPVDGGEDIELKKLREEGYKIIAVIIGDENDTRIFNNETTDLKLSADDMDDFIYKIENEVIEKIQDSYEETTTTEVSTYEINYGTDEDKNADYNIAKNFEDGFNWSNTRLFSLIDNYSGQSDYEDAKELSEKTKFTISSNQTYTITGQDSRVGTTKEIKKWNGEVLKRIIYKSKETPYTANLELQEKNVAELTIKKYASALKVTLANGQVLYYDHVDDYNDDLDKIKPLTAYIDNELAQGARVDIEYTIHIADISKVAFNELYLIDYLPDSFAYDNNTELLTEPDKTNGDYWEGFVESDSLDLSDFSKNSSKRMIMNKAFGLGAGSESNKKDLKMVISRVLSNSNDLEDVPKYNEIEVYSYKTTNPNSAIKDTEFSEGTPRRMGITNGKTNNKDLNSKNYVFPTTLLGADYSSSEQANTVTVIPPTGNIIDAKKVLFVISMMIISLASTIAIDRNIK